MAFFGVAAKNTAFNRACTHLTFRVAGQLYAIEIGMVCEIAQAKAISPIADADPAVIGQIDLRSSALIVVDLGLRLRGKPIKPSAKSVIIVVKREKSRSACLLDAPEGLISISPEDLPPNGCLVDEATGVVGIPESDVVPPENASVSGRERGFRMYKTKNEIILLPDREKFYPM